MKEKSPMLLWAEKEIELACKREKEGCAEVGNSDDWEYGRACYDSAFAAFKTLLKVGHSGTSIGFTKNILNRLIDVKPLTPIYDTDDVWNHIEDERDDYIYYQCKRMSSLFKYVYSDGTIKYKDVNRAYGIEFDDPNDTYHSGLISKIVYDLYPITMPYYPSASKFKVYTETFLTDPKNGDFDTRGVLYLITPKGDRIDIFKYYKEIPNGWEEIDVAEYGERKRSKI